ncbi:MAG: ATP-binding protein [Elusimicrobiota bacterium]
MDMQKEKILEILNDWNFWQKHPFVGIKRDDLLRDIAQLNYKSFAISIIGPRRSGKSILIKQLAEKLIDEGVSSRNILIVNLEDYRWQNLDLALLDEVYSIYLDEINISDKPYIFLDEIHRVPQWERFVRTILEKKEASFFVSGSSAKLLSKELATLLTGRNLVVEVLPLSFKEFLKFNNIEIKEVLDVITGKKEILNLFKKYLEWGGFPEVVLSEEKMAILCQYFEDILEKDVTARYEVRRKDKLNTLAKFYLSNISNLITFRKIEKFLKIPLVTIERFSSYLQDAHLKFIPLWKWLLQG